jgi:peroxiredoxin Q/BCP
MKTLVLTLSLAAPAFASALSVGDPAPAFKAPLHDGSEFSLASRQGKWTVLYFYPKADTPGCTKQACAFRDAIAPIREAGAEVYGISINTPKQQAAFHEKHRLNFALIADEDGAVARAYGTKMPMLPMSKRWTFLIDPELNIRQIEKGADPVKDAPRVAAELQKLKAAKK